MVVTGIYVGLSLSAGAATTVDLSFFFLLPWQRLVGCSRRQSRKQAIQRNKEKTKRERAKNINIKSIRDERENV